MPRRGACPRRAPCQRGQTTVELVGVLIVVAALIAALAAAAPALGGDLADRVRCAVDLGGCVSAPPDAGRGGGQATEPPGPTTATAPGLAPVATPHGTVDPPVVTDPPAATEPPPGAGPPATGPPATDPPVTDPPGGPLPAVPPPLDDPASASSEQVADESDGSVGRSRTDAEAAAVAVAALVPARADAPARRQAAEDAAASAEAEALRAAAVADARPGDHRAAAAAAATRVAAEAARGSAERAAAALEPVDDDGPRPGEEPPLDPVEDPRCFGGGGGGFGGGHGPSILLPCSGPRVDPYYSTPPPVVPPAGLADPPTTGAVPTTSYGGLTDQAKNVVRLVSEVQSGQAQTLPRPFNARIDGASYRNASGALPALPAGQAYTEWTVPTHGAATRGSTRIVAAPDGRMYLTTDHYGTFRAITRVGSLG